MNKQSGLDEVDQRERREEKEVEEEEKNLKVNLTKADLDGKTEDG